MPRPGLPVAALVAAAATLNVACWWWFSTPSPTAPAESPIQADPSVSSDAESEHTAQPPHGEPVDPPDLAAPIPTPALLRHELLGVDGGIADIRLSFDGAVAPAEIGPRLRVESPEGVSLEVLPDPIGSAILVRCPVPDRGPVRIHVLSGASPLSDAGTASIGVERTIVVPVPRAFAVLSAVADQPGFEATSSIELRTSRACDLAQSAPQVVVEPPVEPLSVLVRSRAVRLEGAFIPGNRYTITVPAGLVGRDGAITTDPTILHTTIPDRRAGIVLEASGVLSPHGNLQVPLLTCNIPEVRLDACRVHPDQVVAALLHRPDDEVGRTLPGSTIALDAKPNEALRQGIGLRQFDAEPLGIYRITARDPQQRWLSDRAVVAVTDLGLTLKHGSDGIVAWVTSIRTGAPVANAVVTVRSAANQVLAQANTDGNGLVRLAVPTNHPDGPAFAVTAALDRDLCVLRVRDEWAMRDSSVGGRRPPTTGGSAGPGGLDAFITTERGVYRPGETVHLFGMTRGADGGDVGSVPLTLLVRRPDGAVVSESAFIVDANADGTFHLTYQAPESARTGRYRFSVHVPGAAEAIGGTAAWIEPFVPARLELLVEPATTASGGTSGATIGVVARSLAGPPATGLRVAARGRWVPEAVVWPGDLALRCPPPAEPSDDWTTRDLDLLELEATLDRDGRATVDLPVPAHAPPGLYLGRFVVTVVDEGGRAISTTTTVRCDTAADHLGIALDDVVRGSVFPSGQAIPLRVERRTLDGQPRPLGSVELRLERIERVPELRLVQGRAVWRSLPRADEVRRWAVDGDQVPASITLPSPGSYRLSVADPASGLRTELEIEAAGAGGDRVALDEPDRIVIEPDRPSYRPGDTAVVLVRSPLAGTLLLTLETDRVLATQVLSHPGGSLAVPVRIPANLRGGGYLVATVVREVDPTSTTWLPARAWGVATLHTDHAAQQLGVTISGPDRCEPEQPLDVQVAVETPNSGRRPMVAVWAVDDGILALAPWNLPDAHEHFLGQVRLGVRTGDVFGDLLPDVQPAPGASSIGGDGDGGDDGADLRRGNATAVRRASAILVQPWTETDEHGVLDVHWERPALNGRMRLVALAVAGDRYGAAEGSVVLSAPLMAELSTPRFAAPGDTVEVPVRLVNTTDEPLTVALTVALDGPGRIDRIGEPDAAPPLSIVPPQGSLLVRHRLGVEAAAGAPTTELRVRVCAAAIPPAGASPDALSASARIPDATAEAPVFVRPAVAWTAKTALAVAEVNAPVTIEPSLGVRPEQARVRVVVAGSPKAELEPAVRELLDYPYGCVEQTVGRMLAALIAPRVLPPPTGDDQLGVVLSEYIEVGVDRLRSMQLPSGGLSYWPGGGEPSPWGSAYAALALAEARDLGHEVDPRLLTALAEYLARQVEAPQSVPDPARRALLCEATARLGRPALGWMARLDDDPALDLESRARLALAWHEAGRDDRAEALLGASGATVALATAARLTSAVVQEAKMLDAFVAIAPDRPEADLLARHLLAARDAHGWASTIENAEALGALSRYFESRSEEAPLAANLRAHDGTTRSIAGTGATIRLPGGSLPAMLEVDTGRAMVVVTTEGVPVEPPPALDHALRIRRTWSDRRGEPIDPTDVRVGDVVIVDVTLDAPSLDRYESIEHVAIVDLLPTGLEAEHPRLLTSDRSVDVSVPERTEFLDDRIVLFATATRTAQHYRYALRATAAAESALPAIEASSMYDPAIVSRSGGGRVVVKP
ncbi:MAG: hypothetical protein KDA22_03025 [Phycisphaerales bacterium]|nr:hypothetical protein [Phycisphaerales bacterium]